MPFRPGGVAEAAHIGRYDGVILAEIVEQRNPHVRRVTESMNQYERLRSGAGFQVVKPHGVQIRRQRFIFAVLCQRCCAQKET